MVLSSVDHVLDLPALHSTPDFASLSRCLEEFVIKPSKNFQNVTQKEIPGLFNWLTALVGSPLHWLADSERELIWDLASQRLTERCGRTAAATQTREFEFKTFHNQCIDVDIIEPALTNDNLGMKTWGSAYVLAKRFACCHNEIFTGDLRILELGSGTGLVGIVLAKLGYRVCMTDLPEIVDNLDLNTRINGVNDLAKVAILDWENPHKFELPTGMVVKQPNCIIVADALYSPNHPLLVCQVINLYLEKTSDARLCVQLPLRQRYEIERNTFYCMLRDIGLKQVEYEEVEDDDDFGKTRYAWSLWKW